MARMKMMRKIALVFTVNHTKCKMWMQRISKRWGENSCGGTKKKPFIALFTHFFWNLLHTISCSVYVHLILFFLFVFISFATIKQPNDVRNSPKDLPTFNDATRKFNGAKDVSRDFSISQDNTDRGSMSDQAFACSASSVESLPSASGSSELFLLAALGFTAHFINFSNFFFLFLFWFLCRYTSIGSSRQSK